MKTIENYLSRSSKMMVCWEIRSGRPSKPNLLGMSCQADSKPFRLMFKFSVRNPNYAFMCTCIHTLYQLRYMTYMYIYIYEVHTRLVDCIHIQMHRHTYLEIYVLIVLSPRNYGPQVQVDYKLFTDSLRTVQRHLPGRGASVSPRPPQRRPRWGRPSSWRSRV